MRGPGKWATNAKQNIRWNKMKLANGKINQKKNRVKFSICFLRTVSIAYYCMIHLNEKI